MKQTPDASIEIVSNVPFPPTREKTNRWPLRAMKVGDSFFVKHDNPGFVSVRTAVSYFSLRNKEYKFSTRKVDGGLRIWRMK